MTGNANVNTTESGGDLFGDISMPDVGAYVSLSDISILNIADIDLLVVNTNSTQITLEEIPREDEEYS